MDSGPSARVALVLGAGGVVGQAAVQLARIAGAGRVVACARSAAALERAERLGAHGTARLDGHDGGQGGGQDDVDGLAQRMLDAAGGPVDLVIDPVFGLPAAAALRALRPGGRLVNLGGSADDHCPISSSTLRGRSLHIHGYTNNELDPGQRRAALLTVVAHATAGDLTVEHERVALDDASDAWARQQAGTAGGRIVLIP